MRIWFISLCAALFTLAAALPAQAENKPAPQPLEITRITPEGDDVPASRQIVITFNRAVVPLGKMDRSADEIPVTILPALECEWRWINTSSLACQLGEKSAMKASTTYYVVVNPGIEAEDGGTTAAATEHKFITQRGDVRHSWFNTWRSPGTPKIRLTFNQPVTLKSAEKALSFESGGKITKIKLNVPQDLASPEHKDGVNYFRVMEGEPVKELPLDSRVTLKLAPGLVTLEGDTPSVISRDVTAFDTFPAFGFSALRCTDNNDNEINIKSGEKATAKCNPQAPVALRFSVPVMRSQVGKHVTFTPALASAATADEIWGNPDEEYSRLSRAHQKDTTYEVFLPQGLKAEQVYKIALTQNKPGFFARLKAWLRGLFGKKTDGMGMQDEFGRVFAGGFALEFETDSRRPNFELVHNNAVLEEQTDSEVPLYVNNLKNVTLQYRSVTAAGAKVDQSLTQALPDVRNVQFAVPLGVREALGGKSGAVFGYLDTDPGVPQKSPYERKVFAQVTPWQVHVKIGHFSSLVWVTDMATGAPVEGAKVTFYRDMMVSMAAPSNDNTLATGATDARGVARLSGTETIDPMLELARGYGDDTPRVFVRVDKGDEMALLPAAWEFGIDTWRASNESIYAANRHKFGHIRAWGATAQGIYRAGDTIDYKIYVRNENDRTLEPAPRTGYKLEIIDPMDNTVTTVEDVRLNNFGSFAGQYAVPENAPVGWYKFRLTGEFLDTQKQLSEYERRSNYTWTPINVLVSDFTPAPFRSSTSLNGDLFADGQEVTVQSGARLHSGGPYADANARVTAMLEPRSFRPKNPAAAGFFFAPSEDEYARQLNQTTQPLDAQGDLQSTFKIEARDIVFGRLTVETAVQDDRGKYVASQAQADFVGRDRFVGIRGTKWVYSAKEEARIEYTVTDERGDFAEDYPVNVVIEKQVTRAAKVKGAGNAYLTEYSVEWEKAAACSGKSGKGGTACAFTPDSAGYYRAIASIQDTQERTHSSTEYMWVSGRDFVMWHNESDVLLPIVPEKAEYNVGDTARYLVKNPWPGAEALVTVERYGVIDSFTMKLDSSTPIIEIPVKPDYLPGFYLSVVVTSPRAADVPVEGGVDLGKPAFRMGYVTVPVKDPYKQMNVSISTDAEIYRPRDKVSVTLNAVPKHPQGREPVEIAVAVLDESVFDLIAGGAKAYDPYDGFYTLEGLDLKNYNLLTRLIGRQKFEKKGANPGGDGGADFAMRDLFKFVAYWNPSLMADSNGNAQFTFELPDNLTGWRVLAMAVTPTDRLGLGQGTFKVNRPTEVRPVMPNQVTERDTFNAGFSVMNRTDKARTLDVDIAVTGPVDKANPAKTTQQITLEPYKRTTVYMPVQVASLPETADVAKGELVFTVKAHDAADGDGMVHRVPVGKMRSLETAANYGSFTEDQAKESILFPEGIYGDVGGVSVVLAPSVIGSVEGAFKYMRDYPYLCWEQILSKGVMAAHYQNLKGYMPEGFKWEGSEALPQSTLDKAAAFQAPNGGMSFFIARDEYVSPYLSAYTAMAFNWMRASGHKVPEAVEKKLHAYLQNFLRNDVTPGFYTEGMRSTVRAVALAALTPHGKVTMDDIERYRAHAKGMSLFGKAHYMQAALGQKEGGTVAAETAKMILSHGNQTGGKFMFSEELDDSYTRILATPLRDNCAVLDAFTTYAGREDGRNLVGDVPFKLVRSITQTRQNRDHWENTQENLFCMNALTSYSRVYERDAVNMNVTAKLDGQSFGETSFADLRDAPVTLARGMQPADVGRKASLDIDRSGSGRLYYAARVQYAPKAEFSKETNAGIEIRREYSVERDGEWQLLKPADTIKRGDIVRADIYLSLPAPRNFVVVDDPIPGGLEPVNRDLATASEVDAAKASMPMAGGSWWFKFNDWMSYGASRWSFYHRELRHDRAVFYSDYLPAGNYHLGYTAQAIAEGSFAHMPVHAEEMYDPDVYGKGVRGQLDVATP